MIQEMREHGMERLQRIEEWVIAQRKTHKNAATADSKGLESAVADVRKEGGQEVLCTNQ